MNAAENAFNALYPPALRIAALHGRLVDLERNGDDDTIRDLMGTLRREIEELTRQVDAIEAGMIDDTLQTSIAAVLSQMRRRESHT